MKRLRTCLMVAGVMLALAWNATAFAQKDVSTATPKYDVASETTLKGTIAEVKQIDSAKGASAIHLMVKTGEQVLEVFLCPNAFLQEMQMGFAQGDQVQVTGSKVKVDETEVVLAREVTKGNDTLILRDKKGAPVWTPVRRG